MKPVPRPLKNLALLKSGIDPIDARRDLKQANIQAAADTAKLKTFEMLSYEYYDAHASDWTSIQYRGKFLSSLRAYAFDKLGPLLPAAIDVSAVREVIEPIWLTKNPTADRVRGRIENVLDFATALKLRSGERPARWSVLETVLPKGRHSVGVARQYCGQLGKQDNCQVAVSLSLANHHASLPVAYQLYLPEDWVKWTPELGPGIGEVKV